MLTSLRSPNEIGGTKCIIEALFFPRFMHYTSFLIFAHLLWFEVGVLRLGVLIGVYGVGGFS